MAGTALKNQLTPGSAAADLGLGLGDQLQDQVGADLEARRKQKKMGGGQDQSPYNAGGLSMAAMSLGLSASVPK